MGEINRDQVIAILKRDNVHARMDDVSMYADCFMDYREAADNIGKNGNIVLHPRTGSPIENPYIKVKALAMANLRKIVRLKNVNALWV